MYICIYILFQISLLYHVISLYGAAVTNSHWMTCSLFLFLADKFSWQGTWAWPGWKNFSPVYRYNLQQCMGTSIVDLSKSWNTKLTKYHQEMTKTKSESKLPNWIISDYLLQFLPVPSSSFQFLQTGPQPAPPWRTCRPRCCGAAADRCVVPRPTG